jgi:HAD superfamily hydrolase (TIGR01509 family)
MALDGIIFDMDGTLVDTNAAHVEAWRRAFESCGYKVPADRIAVEVGKGGDFLVPAVLGAEADHRDGARLRHASQEAFLDIASHTHFELMPGARELIARLHERGLKLALATSSKHKHLRATLDSLGLDLPSLFDVLVTADDTEHSKPAPDLVHAAVQKLDLFAAQCAMVGDTPYDAMACRQAGVACLGVLCGGNDAKTLRRAGARGAWRDPADLLAHLDTALQVASPGTMHWTREAAEALMREAVASAQAGSAAGERPEGCALARGDGSLVTRAHPAIRRTGVPTAHATLVAAALAAQQGTLPSSGLVLACTAEPCILCTGAAIELGVDTIFFALPAAGENNPRRILPSETDEAPLPRIVGDVLTTETRTLLADHEKASGRFNHGSHR